MMLTYDIVKEVVSLCKQAERIINEVDGFISINGSQIETYVHMRPEALALIPGKLYLSNRGSSDFPVELYKVVDGIKFLAIIREMSNYPGWTEDENIKGGDNKNEQT